jgi:hypothetical protein
MRCGAPLAHAEASGCRMRRALFLLLLPALLLVRATPAAADVLQTLVVTAVVLKKPPAWDRPAANYSVVSLLGMAEELRHQVVSRPYVAARECGRAVWWAGIHRSGFDAYAIETWADAAHTRTQAVIHSIGTARETATFTRCVQRYGLVVRALR